MKYFFFLLILLAAYSANAQKRRAPGKNPNEAERSMALALISSADSIQQSIHWPNITPQLFMRNVRRNIEKPFQMNNGRNTNFCSYGALTYTCLKNEPLRYAKCMIDLYRNGEAMYRNILLAPPAAIRQSAGKMIFQGDLDIYPADQAWFLSLAHRFKGYLNFFNRKYQAGDENTMWASTNLAKFNRMLRKLCKYKVDSRGSDLVRPRSNDLTAFLKEKMSEGEVYLYLNNTVLRKKNHNRLQQWIPTHYVVLLEVMEEDKDTVLVKYWDGGYKTFKVVSLNSLKQVIYGISWVRYDEKSLE